jgi:hypothetical protein
VTSWKLAALVLAVIAVVVAARLLFIESSEAPEMALEGNASAGAPWDGHGRGNMNEAVAREFPTFDLYWLGPSFRGLNLQGIQYDIQYGPRPEHPEHVLLVYGDCPLPEGRKEGCPPVPLQIDIRPACSVTPGVAQARGYRDSPLEKIRGEALLLRSQGEGQGTIVWTGNAFVSINGYKLTVTDLDSILHSLERLNVDGGEAGEPLPPPNFSGCP